MGDMTHPCPKCDASLSYSVTVNVAPELFYPNSTLQSIILAKTIYTDCNNSMNTVI